MDLLCGKRGLDVAQGGMVFQDNLAVDDFASRTQGHGSQLPTRQIPRSHNSEGFRWYYAPKRESGIMTRSLDRTRRSKPWLTMVDTRVEVSGFVRPRRWG